MPGAILIIGIGPGGMDWIAPGAIRALESVDVILGYHTYLRQIATIAPHIRRESSGMRHEVERARRAITLAQAGQRVALVSGGDAGIYGMAGLVFELLDGLPRAAEIHAEVLPGISALNAAAAVLGAPLMNDFAAISLSDYMTPLEEILQRLKLAAQAGFVLCLYNPRSRTRHEPLERACAILEEVCGPQTLVGVVRAAGRAEQQACCVHLDELPQMDIGMDTLLIVGNASTRQLAGRMVTRRGYALEKNEGASE